MNIFLIISFIKKTFIIKNHYCYILLCLYFYTSIIKILWHFPTNSETLYLCFIYILQHRNNKLKWSHILYTTSPFYLFPNLNLPKKVQQIHIQNIYKPWNIMKKIGCERNDRPSNHKFTYAHTIPCLRFHIYLTSSSMSNDNTVWKYIL